jgi:hypothetical protein
METEQQKPQSDTQSDNLAKAKAEIEEIVKKYNIALIPVVMHHGDKTLTRIDIVPVEETEQKAE